MNTITRLILDLSKQTNQLNEIVKIRQGESNSTILQAEILDHNQALNLSGDDAELHLQKPNSEVYIQKANLSNNQVTCTLAKEAVEVAGDAQAYFQICNKDKSVINTTNTFYLQILPGLIPARKKDPNEPQPVDLHTLSDNNERKVEWI